ncbi:uncharacterized protein DEA37_0004725 [Paragonimus westermani]|uniref:Calponin-homology (CH) domain-containing protein n=1 Tax=Paragonimus westermani TaxID=34504 RepID=A0A5J4P2E9_9TREM|nr:uncharacterized protein DEA37_0004725 [Paragonimus westermani]
MIFPILLEASNQEDSTHSQQDAKYTDLLDSLIEISPDHGHLNAFETTPIIFHLRPRWKTPKLGFLSYPELPPVKPFSMYLLIKKVEIGAADESPGKDTDDSKLSKEDSSQIYHGSQKLEVIVTGTLVPVQLAIKPAVEDLQPDVNSNPRIPSRKSLSSTIHDIQGDMFVAKLPGNRLMIDYGQCKAGASRQMEFRLLNQAKELPIRYTMPRVAHFIPRPASGVIKPNSQVKITVEFMPKQYGIVPLIVNEVGIGTDLVKYGFKAACPRMALVGQTGAQSALGLPAHVQRDWRGFLGQLKAQSGNQELAQWIAFPNDRTASIRPCDRSKPFRTPFCRILRYTYHDPDYELTNRELQQRLANVTPYTALIRKHADLISQIERDATLIQWEVEPNSGLAPFDADTELKPLNISELGIYDGGPSTVDFGDVCPNTKKTSTVKVVNPLDQCILLDLDLSVEELCQTCPRSYLVRPRSMAEMTVILKTDRLGKFQKNLNFSINGHHKSNLVICATVVPVRLEIDPPTLELTMTDATFGLVSQSGLRGIVLLRNPLHARTHFVWELTGRTSTAFTVRPVKGVVEPFSNLACEVIHYPSLSACKQGTFRLRLPSNIGCAKIIKFQGKERENVSQDQLLQCYVTLPPCKLAFNMRRITLGPIAHALPAKRQIRLTNYGESPAFYRILKQPDDSELIPAGVPMRTDRRLSNQVPVSVTIRLDPEEGEVPVAGHIDIQRLSLVAVTYVFSHFFNVFHMPNNLLGVHVGGSSFIGFGIENLGLTEALVELNFADHPEFSISDQPCGQPETGQKNYVDMQASCLDVPNSQALHSNGEFHTTSRGQPLVRRNSKQVKSIGKILIPANCHWEGSLCFSPTEVGVHDFALSVTVNKMPINMIQSEWSEPSEIGGESARDENPKLFVHRILAVGIRQSIAIDPKDGNVFFTINLNPADQTSKQAVSQKVFLTCLDKAPVGWALGLIGVHQFNKNGKGLLELRDQNDTLLTSNIDGVLEGTLVNVNDRFQFVLRCTPRKPGSFQISLPLWLNKSAGKADGRESVHGERSSERILYRCFQIHIRVTEAHLICSPSRVLFPTIPLGCEVRQFVELRSTRIDRSLSVSVCWPVPENVQPETIGHTADLDCPFTVEFPDGHVFNTDMNIPGQSYTKPLKASIRFRSHVNGLLLAPHPRPACLVFTANQSDCKNGSNSFDRQQANRRLACVAVPISAAVDNSLTSWFDLVSRQPNSFTIGFAKDSLDVEHKLTKAKLTDSGVYLKCLYNLTGEIQLIQSCRGPDGSQQSLVSITNSSDHANGSFGLPTTESLYSDSGRQLTAPDMAESDRVSPNIPCVPETTDSNLPDQTSCISWSSCIERHATNLTVLTPENDVPVRRPETEVDEMITKSVGLLHACLSHLCEGKAPPGVPTTITYPANRPKDALAIVFFYLASLITFVRSQGGCLPHVLPEHLMNPTDYHKWYSLDYPGLTESGRVVKLATSTMYDPRRSVMSFCSTGESHHGTDQEQSANAPIDSQACEKQSECDTTSNLPLSVLPEFNTETFEYVSRRCWTDLMLQLLKLLTRSCSQCLVIQRIQINKLSGIRRPFHKFSSSMADVQLSEKHATIKPEKPQLLSTTCEASPKCPTPDLQTSDKRTRSSSSSLAASIVLQLQTDSASNSNCYSASERVLLTWTNYCFEHGRTVVWHNTKSEPPNRLIINFDHDFSDGLVLACLIGLYVPSVIPHYISQMYTEPLTREHCLHNAILLVQALKTIHMDFDIRPTDITSPHPVGILLFCLHLFHVLPDYTPHQLVEFIADLSKTQLKIIKLINLPVLYVLDTNNSMRPRFLRRAEAILFAVSQRCGPVRGKTVAFTLIGSVNGIGPLGGYFNITTIESPQNLFQTVCHVRGLQCPEFRLAHTESTNMSTAMDKLASSTECWTEAMTEDLTEETFRPGCFDSSGTLQSFFCQESGLLLDAASMNDLTAKITITDEKGTRQSEQDLQHTDVNAVAQKSVHVVYLPLSLGVRHCCLMFTNEQIGEFFVLFRGSADLPKPSTIPFIHDTDFPNTGKQFKTGYRLTSAVASASFGRSGDPNVVYLRAPVGHCVSETLLIPKVNEALQDATRIAVRLRLPPTELHRRRLANTLDSPDLLGMADKLLALPKIPSDKLIGEITKIHRSKRSFKRLVFNVSVDSSFITVPSTVELSNEVIESTGISCFPVDVTINLRRAGLFPAKLIVQRSDDIRVYCVECVGVPDTLKITLNFSAPLNQSVTQPVPIVNKSSYDWNLEAYFTGAAAWFSGPSKIHAPAGCTTNYTVTFLARRETDIEAGLELVNTTDGSKHVFILNGTGLKPLSSGQIKLKCKVGGCKLELDNDSNEKRSARKQFVQLHPFTLKVPNPTSKKQIYRLETDIPPSTLTWLPQQHVNDNRFEVLPGRTEECKLYFRVSKRGQFSGIIVFIADDGNKVMNKTKDSQALNSEQDETSKQAKTVPSNQLFQSVTSKTKLDAQQTNQMDSTYRVWYEVFMVVEPGQSLRNIEVTCSCLSSKLLEIPFSLPEDCFQSMDQLELEVAINGSGLSGSVTHVVRRADNPGESTYRLEYRPSVVGEKKGSITFHHPTCGEFWIALTLRATEPEVVKIPVIECELGKSKVVSILLNNPTDETYKLKPQLTNCDVYTLNMGNSAEELDKSSARLHGGSSIRKNLGVWRFTVCGRGLPPQPRETVCTYVSIGSATTLIIPITNPLKHPVIMDIYLTAASVSGLLKRLEETRRAIVDSSQGSLDPLLTNVHRASRSPSNLTLIKPEEEPFQLLLKRERNIRLDSKTSFDIPLSFAPVEMRETEAICCVVMRRADGHLPKPGNKDTIEEDEPLEIRWLIPLKGTPEASAEMHCLPLLNGRKNDAMIDSIPPLISGIARSTVRYQININLSSTIPLTKRPGSINSSILPEDRPSTIQIHPIGSASSRPMSDRSVAKASPTVLIGNSATWIKFESGDISWKLEPVIFSDNREREELCDLDHLLASSVNIHLKNASKPKPDGVMGVQLGVIFSPPRPFKCSAELTIRSELGAVWRFALTVEAKDPPVDDVIFMPIKKLGAEVRARVVLTSQSAEPEPFIAQLYPSKETEFEIEPKMGVLPPVCPTGGHEMTSDHLKHLPACIHITFTPSSYGKPKRARLVVQTAKMEWHYQLIGDVPTYVVPQKEADRSTIRASESRDRKTSNRPHKRNYILHNQKTLGRRNLGRTNLDCPVLT